MSTEIRIDDTDYPIGDAVAEYIAELETQLSKAKSLIRHADDKHAELQAELAKLQWVSVEDRLPTKVGLYLTKYRGDKRQHLHEANWIRSYPFGSIFTDQWISKTKTKYSVTHWMPIPPLPESENNNG